MHTVTRMHPKTEFLNDAVFGQRINKCKITIFDMWPNFFFAKIDYSSKILKLFRRSGYILQTTPSLGSINICKYFWPCTKSETRPKSKSICFRALYCLPRISPYFYPHWSFDHNDDGVRRTSDWISWDRSNYWIFNYSWSNCTFYICMFYFGWRRIAANPRPVVFAIVQLWRRFLVGHFFIP